MTPSPYIRADLAPVAARSIPTDAGGGDGAGPGPGPGEGWAADPFGRHEVRWMSDGKSTALVRDGDVESYDPPDEEPSPAPDATAQRRTTLARLRGAQRQ